MQPWCDALEELLRRQAYDLVVPATDGCLVPIVLHRARFESLARLAVPDAFGFEQTHFKQNTIAMANQLGVPVPQTVVLHVAELDKFESGSGMDLPLVIKPVSSKLWLEAKRLDVAACLVQDRRLLRQRAQELLKLTPVLVQSYFRGVGVGQEFLTIDGNVLTAFQHQRLHEPLQGGGSSYRKSVPLHAGMLKHSARMLEHMKWTGVAMVEYKWNPNTDEFALMEINGRFWGSLPLAVAAGIDFPADLYNLLVEGRRLKRNAYRTGVYSRKVADDVWWFVENWQADRRNPCLMTVPRRRAIAEWMNLLRGKEHWDSLTLDDPLPGLVDLVRLARRCKAKLGRRLRARTLQYLAQVAAWRRAQGHRLRRLLRTKPVILFVCHGNIYRSPFAERIHSPVAEATPDQRDQSHLGGAAPCRGEARAHLGAPSERGIRD
jgi:predicted ATP-grasp superfamily ATP-dependent carboligase